MFVLVVIQNTGRNTIYIFGSGSFSQKRESVYGSNFGEFLTLNLNNTKSISYIFNVNTSNNRCVIPVLLCHIVMP